MRSSHLDCLIDCNLRTLASATDLVARLSSNQYRHLHQPYFESSLGKHLRHILDHYLCFQRDFSSGLIDYDQRQRDYRLESDREHALRVIVSISKFLGTLRTESVTQSLRVLMCNDVAVPQGEIAQSSLGRELQFLQSHSVHHYALMAAMLHFAGINVSEEFGVAPSTLVHEKAVRETA